MSEQPAPRPDVPTWDLADRLRKALRTAGLGVQDMADYLEVSRTSVSNWINGRIDPSAQTMRLIAMRCGVNYKWLRTGISDPVGADGPNPGPGTSAKVSPGEFQSSHAPHICAVIPLNPARMARIGDPGPSRKKATA